MSQEPGKVGLSGESSPVLTSTPSGGQRRVGSSATLPRRGGRKKTLSLNPEEREALENLIEEVIIDGGMGDSESASSDEEDNPNDGSIKEKSDAASNLGLNITGSDPKTLAAFKMSKKFYPGQLKVALKHMTDLPPRFSRKLKKAEKYLEMNATQKKTSVSTSIKEEDEEEVVLSFDATANHAVPSQDQKATTVSPKQTQADKEKNKAQKERTQKDLKKTIRSLLTDLDQYVDEKDRVSVSLDLPGAVSCADLERETLGFSANSSESASSSKVEVGGKPVVSEATVVERTNESPGVEKQKVAAMAGKSADRNANQFGAPPAVQFAKKNYSAPTVSSTVRSPSNPDAPKPPGTEHPKHPAPAEKSAFRQHPNLTSANFIDGNPVMMPIQQLMPPIDFSLPPPSTFQFPPQYGLPSSQDSFVQSGVQFQPQFSFVELSSGASIPSHSGPNYSTTPVIFQQYNALPVVSQSQQVPSFPYASSPGYFVGRFNYPSQPINYLPQFQAQSPILNPDSMFKPGPPEYHGVNPKHAPNNSTVGNFRPQFKIKPGMTGSPKVDNQNAKSKYFRHPRHDPHIKQELMRQGFASKEASLAGSHEMIGEIKYNLSSKSDTPPTPCEPQNDRRSTSESTDKFTESPTSCDAASDSSSNLPSAPDVSDVGPNEPTDSDASLRNDDDANVFAGPDPPERVPSDQSTTGADELLAADIDLRSNETRVEAGKSGLRVVLGPSLVRKLDVLFADDNSRGAPSSPVQVFLSADVLKEIFKSLCSPENS